MRTRAMIGALGLVVLGGSAFAFTGLTRDELGQRLGGGKARVEVHLAADGSVRHVEVERGHGRAADLEGRVVAIDVKAGTLQVEHLGVVDFKQAKRHRTERTTLAKNAWADVVAGALSRGETVWLDADGAFSGKVFVAREVELDDSPERSLEVDVPAGAFDATSGVLKIGGLSLALGAAPVRLDDRDDRGRDDRGRDRDDDDDDRDDDDRDDDDDDDRDDDRDD